jgi:hypothetical protein
VTPKTHRLRDSYIDSYIMTMSHRLIYRLTYNDYESKTRIDPYTITMSMLYRPIYNIKGMFVVYRSLDIPVLHSHPDEVTLAPSFRHSSLPAAYQALSQNQIGKQQPSMGL